MPTSQKQSLCFFALALGCAIAFFLAIFLGHIDHYLAIGVAILAAIGFLITFNRAWDLWEMTANIKLAPASNEHRNG